MKHFIFDKLKNNSANIFLFVLMAIFYLSIGCPFRYLFGISCPGCGMSRAAVALMKLDFPAAISMHPLVFLLPVVAAVYLFRKRIPKKAMTVLCITALLIMLGVYLIRMLHGSEIVYCNIETGLFYKIFQFILN